MLTSPTGVAADGTVVQANALIVHEKIIGAARLRMGESFRVARRALFAHLLTSSTKVCVFTGTRAILRVIRCAVRARETPELTLAGAAVLRIGVWSRDKRTFKQAIYKPSITAICDFAVGADVGVHALARPVFKLA